MHKKYIVLLTLVVSTLMGCSAGNIPIPSDDFPDFEITGQWAVLGSDNWQNEIMFDFRPAENAPYQLKVWGYKVQLDSIRLGSNQFIFSYQLDEQQSFSVLGTVLSDNHIKLSRVRDHITDFQPLGMLGEKVYYLERIVEGEPHMLTKAPATKRSSLKKY